MPLFLLNLQQALRGLRQAPAFAAAAILTLALGIGANTALFSALNSVLLRPLPFPEPHQLVEASETSDPARSGRFSPASFFEQRERSAGVLSLAAYSGTTAELTGWGGPQSLKAGQVSSGFFEVLGLPPRAGSYFTRAQEAAGEAPGVVLSEGLWQWMFAGDPAAVGQRLFLDGKPTVILGVAPAAVVLPLEGPQDLYLPLVKDPAPSGFRYLHGLGRLQAGVSPGQGREALKAITAALNREAPGKPGTRTAYLNDLHTEMVGDSRRPLLLLMAAAGLLLLIACSNVASLFLVRAAGRRHELAVRIALGASRGQLAGQYFAEGLVVSTLGAALGLVLAVGILQALPGLLPTLPGLGTNLPMALDGPALACALVAALATGLLFGAAPALQARGLDPQAHLLNGGRGASARGAVRSAFVAFEVALAMLLLLGSGLLLHSFIRVLRTAPGFELAHLTTFSVTLPAARYPESGQVIAFERELGRRLAALPGVTSAGLATLPPIAGVAMSTRFHEGRTVDPNAEWEGVGLACVDGGFFRTLRAPMLQGRVLGPEDLETGPAVLVVNAAFAKTHFRGRSPLGSQLLLGFASDRFPRGTLWEIVGVVGDLRDAGLEQVPFPKLYAPLAQLPAPQVSAVLRAEASASALGGLLRAQVAALDPAMAVSALRDVEDLARERRADRTQSLILLTAFAALALLLAAIGIYGLLAFSVAQRTREMGIRAALGAAPGRIRSLVLVAGLKPVALGLMAGVVGFLLLGRVLTHQLYGVDLLDPWTLVAVPLLLAAVALAACWAPIHRATRVNPVVALRND